MCMPATEEEDRLLRSALENVFSAPKNIPPALAPYSRLITLARARYDSRRPAPVEVSILGAPVLLADWPSEVARCWRRFEECPSPEQDGRCIVLHALQQCVIEGKAVAGPLRFQAARIRRRAGAQPRRQAAPCETNAGHTGDAAPIAVKNGSRALRRSAVDAPTEDLRIPARREPDRALDKVDRSTREAWSRWIDDLLADRSPAAK